MKNINRIKPNQDRERNKPKREKAEMELRKSHNMEEYEMHLNWKKIGDTEFSVCTVHAVNDENRNIN